VVTGSDIRIIEQSDQLIGCVSLHRETIIALRSDIRSPAI
jgi:hypothetical protein